MLFFTCEPVADAWENEKVSAAVLALQLSIAPVAPACPA